jgi:shikimate dehydrogenase
VLGAPIDHSLSPALHRAAYRHLGLTWRYEAVLVQQHELAGFVAALDADWRGLSLTMPLKRVALEVADAATPLAASVGVANTLLLEPGSVVAENTDVAGVRAALAERGLVHASTASVLGGGATAASSVAALATIVDEVVAAVRSPQRAASLLDVAAATGARLRLVPWSDAAATLQAQVVVATTPRGVADALAASVPPAPGVLLDVVYDPWPTALAAAWTAAGGTVAGGLDLLVHQAADQVRLMTGQSVPVAVLREAGLAAQARR